MKHMTRMTSPSVAGVSVEDAVQVIGLLSALLKLFRDIGETLGIQKVTEQ